ncbi:MAG: hypothetical protein JW795_08360, partial [Chitinivibrionales bacterium]|nr:hypothetical protein [Chitinivibrionales bacterium]
MVRNGSCNHRALALFLCALSLLGTGFLLLPTKANAQATEFSGVIPSLHHTLSDTIIVTGQIIVPAGSTLTILPGSVLLFSGSCGITVNGTLSARGTTQDSIYFLQPNTVYGWTGIRFDVHNEIPTPSILDYCRVENAFSTDGNGGGIIIRQSHDGIILRRCLIRNCRSQPGTGRGSALHADSSSNLSLSECRIEKNYGLEGAIFLNRCSGVTLSDVLATENVSISGDGGALFAISSRVDIVTSRFSANNARNSGGAISARTCTLAITGSSFISNLSNGYGGAVSILNGTVTTISSSIFKDNQAYQGGAIAFDKNAGWVRPVGRIVNCLFDGNRALYDGGALTVYGQNTSVLVANTTIVRNHNVNSGVCISFNTNSTRLVNCIAWLNKGKVFDVDKSNVATHSAIQADSRGEGNTELYPQFSDTTAGIWTLTEKSPCINTGTEDTTGLSLPGRDIVGNPRIFDDFRVDMGAYEFMGATPTSLLRLRPKAIDSIMGLNNRDTLLCTLFNKGSQSVTIDSIRLSGSGAVGFITPPPDRFPIGPSSHAV